MFTVIYISPQVGKGFMPYRLPKTCMWFWPPRIMTDVLKPVHFLGQAKVGLHMYNNRQLPHDQYD